MRSTLKTISPSTTRYSLELYMLDKRWRNTDINAAFEFLCVISSLDLL